MINKQQNKEIYYNFFKCFLYFFKNNQKFCSILVIFIVYIDSLLITICSDRKYKCKTNMLRSKVGHITRYEYT